MFWIKTVKPFRYSFFIIRTYLKNAVIEDEEEYEVMQRSPSYSSSSSSSLSNAQWLSSLSRCRLVLFVS
jgi:hypothetical protein